MADAVTTQFNRITPRFTVLSDAAGLPILPLDVPAPRIVTAGPISPEHRVICQVPVRL